MCQVGRSWMIDPRPGLGVVVKLVKQVFYFILHKVHKSYTKKFLQPHNKYLSLITKCLLVQPQ